MKNTICITVLNEKNKVKILLNSLLNQTETVDEIVIVDAGSSDGTIEAIKNYSKKYNIKLIVKKCTRAEGRNLAVKAAKNCIIAMTDAGCIADKYWLENITKPFKDKKVDMVAGFYIMRAENSLQKAISVYLGVLPKEFNDSFLPSARSVAFRKSLWKKVGGFPENLKDTAEDTIFNQKVVESKAKIVREKEAVVYWEVPNSISEFYKKIRNYAKGDAVSGVFWHPTKKWKTHNIKALSVFLRYLIFLFLFIVNQLLFAFTVLIYLFWSFRKVFRRIDNTKAGAWGAVLQIISDFAVMSGFISGTYSRILKL
jgi:glycosyltransferase involved in cell wall biosynthesis